MVLTAISFGMQWGMTKSGDEVIPGFYVPDSYVVNYGEGVVDTIPGFVGAPIFLPGYNIALSGYDMPARVWLVTALILAGLALRTGRRRLLGGAALMLVVAVVLSGLRPLPGEIIALAAAVLFGLLSVGRTPRIPARQYAGQT